MKHIRLLSSLLILFVCSCTNDTESDLLQLENQEKPDETGPITYMANIKSIVDSNCIGCHSSPPVNGAPFSLITYNQVRAFADNGSLFRAMNRQTGEASAMPPSGRLPQASIDLISQWIEDGLLEE